MTDNNKKNQLKGRENFLPWLTRLETLLTLDDVVTRNEETDKLEVQGLLAPQKEQNEKIAKKYVIQNCDDCVMHSINPSESFTKIMTKLNASYGFGNMDPSIILNQLRDIKFHPSKDPSIVLNEIDMRLAELESAGGLITDSQMVQYIHDGLSGDSLRDNFWFNCKGAMNMKKLSTFTVETAGQYIVQFWYSYKPKQSAEKSNLTEEKKGKYEKRLCQHCSDAKRFRIMKTHNTNDCRINAAEAGKTEPDTTNKANANYSFLARPLYHDSGTSKTMINYRPEIVESKNITIPVFTAGASQPPELGTARGKIKFGSLNLDVIEVPSFSKNLLSATQLSREHGCRQTIEPWTAKLTISKDDKIVATGTYDTTEKLIKIDDQISEQASKATEENDWTTVHRKLGHAGDAMIKKTLAATTGIALKNSIARIAKFQRQKEVPLAMVN